MKKSYLPSRRRMIQTSLATTGLILSSGFARAMRPATTLPTKLSLYLTSGLAGLRYPFTLPELPFAHGAFAPGIDPKTMQIHHGKHHAGYVRKLNAALESAPEWQSKTLGELLFELETLPQSIQISVRQNGGGHANHALYWGVMRPGGSSPTGKMAAAIQDQFGGLSDLREELKAAALGRFGSGWAWLVSEPDGTLLVRSTPNQDSPYMDGQLPLFGIDVWEHAYYLNYQNRRGDYVDAFLDLADWEAASKIYAEVVG
jgi:Fe-Mn family superoxide dismutase